MTRLAQRVVFAFICSWIALAAGAAEAGGAQKLPVSPPPNLFPSWLSSFHSARYEAVTYQVPWLATATQTASGPWSLRSPIDGAYVRCDGTGPAFGTLPQPVTSSANGRFGATNLVASPCTAAAGLFCSSFGTTITPEDIATAQANAYVSLRAFSDYFAGLGWFGIDGVGTPARIEFGPLIAYLSNGWNATTLAPQYCPHHQLHIDHHVHELVHGIVQHTADFTYNFSGSGGTVARIFNEAYADFFAEMVEFDAAIPDTSSLPGSAGDYVVVTGKDDLGVSGAFHQPPRPCHTDPLVGGTTGYYVDGGPIRHAMYLLAEGTDPPAPLPHSNVCQGPSVLAGIGRAKTAEIFFDALLHCDWRKDGPTMDFCDIRRCTIEAASCPEHDAVVRAWNAVSPTASACGVWDKACPAGPKDPYETR
jgi:hypothetical protein